MGCIPGHKKEYRVKVVGTGKYGKKVGEHVFNLGREDRKWAQFKSDRPNYFTKAEAQARARTAQKMWPNYKALVLKRKKRTTKKAPARNMENFLGGIDSARSVSSFFK